MWQTIRRSRTKGSFGSYAAIGDSFTEGVGDPGPGGTFVGWADRFAVLLDDRRAGTHLPLRQSRRTRQAPRPDRRGTGPAREGTRPRPGDVLRGRQRHHPARHRPRRRRGALRTGGRRTRHLRRHGHGDDRVRHPRRARPAPSARQDRHVHRARPRHRRPLRLPRARPLVAQVRPGQTGLGRTTGCTSRPRATRVWHCAPPRCSAWTCPPTRTSRGRRCRRAARSKSAATTSNGRASTWCRGSAAGCGARSSGDHVEPKRPDLLPL